MRSSGLKIFLTCMLFLGFSVVFVLPTAQKLLPGVVMTWPDFIGDWFGQEAAVTEKERTVLGKETQFARKLYTNTQGDSIYVSIVLAGEDMSTSIHRPERCMPSQGFTIIEQHATKTPIEGGDLTMTRLHNMRPLYDLSGKPLLQRDGRQTSEDSLLYYWFVGATETTADHTARYFIDARDRLLKGSSQPWAYVTVMSRISSKHEKFGRDEAQTDAMIQEFIQKLAPIIQGPRVKIR